LRCTTDFRCGAKKTIQFSFAARTLSDDDLPEYGALTNV